MLKRVSSRRVCYEFNIKLNPSSPSRAVFYTFDPSCVVLEYNMSGNPAPSSRSRLNAPTLSISTAGKATGPRTDQSPHKSTNLKLYDLPPSLDSPGLVSASRRARPGGFAAMRSDSSDARSIHSDMYDRGSHVLPLSHHPLRLGPALPSEVHSAQTSPHKERSEPSQEVSTKPRLI